MAANAPIGTNIWEGVLGVVDVFFDDVYMGRTTADTELVIDQDIKDILFGQSGTKYADKVRTGIALQILATFGDITTARLEKWQKGFEKSGGSGDSVKLGRSLYQSWLQSEAKTLLLKRVDSEGNASTDPRHQLKMYKAAPEITGNFQWGPDTQRNVAMTFHCFFDTTNNAFGYSGFASSLGIAS